MAIGDNKVKPVTTFEDGNSASSIDKIGKTIDEKTTTIFGMLREVAERIYGRNALEGIVEFPGQVYSVETVLSHKNDDSLHNNTLNSLKNTLYYKCKVRLPDIHTFLDIPSTFGETENDQKIIDLYQPYFYYYPNENSSPVAVGDFVTVKFENLATFSDGKIIKKNSDKSSGQGSIAPAGATPQKKEIKDSFSSKTSTPTTVGNSRGV